MASLGTSALSVASDKKLVIFRVYVNLLEGKKYDPYMFCCCISIIAEELEVLESDCARFASRLGLKSEEGP